MKTISNPNDFELQFTTTFGNIDRSTFVDIPEDRVLQIELGGQGNNEVQRLEQALGRSNKILQYCFGGKAIWLRIVLWTSEEEKNLADAGFKSDKATKVFKRKEDYQKSFMYATSYIHFNRYSKLIVSPLTKANINYDLKVDPYTQISCYYINFNSKLIVNIYDDRGLLIHTPNKDSLKKIENEFYKWLV